MFCPSCGKPLIEGGSFCLYCGEPVPKAALEASTSPSSHSQVPIAPPTVVQRIQPAQIPLPGPSSFRVRRITVVLTLVLTVVFLVFMALVIKALILDWVRVEDPSTVYWPYLPTTLGIPVMGFILLLGLFGVWRARYDRVLDKQQLRVPTVISLLGTCSFLLLLLLSLLPIRIPSASGSSNLVGKWYRDTSQVAPTPTSTGDRLLDLFDKSLKGWQCATADSLEFLSDGTVSASSSFFGSGAGKYEVVDGNRLKIESPKGSVLWTFSVEGDVLTIQGETGCADTRWRPFETESLARPTVVTKPTIRTARTIISPSETPVMGQSSTTTETPTSMVDLPGTSDEILNVTMYAQNGSGEDGMVVINQNGIGEIMILIRLSNGTPESQLAHIHRGSCTNLDPNPAFPLTSVVNGYSETVIPRIWLTEIKEGYAINVHRSAAEPSTYVSCGNIPGNMMDTPGIP